MNLRDLHYLASVAEHLHFGKAADACNVSQPTLSMQLKKLEDTLGVQLFERDNKHVMLTPIGKDITARANRVLREAESIRQAAKSAANPYEGDIKLGIFPTLAPYFLPDFIPALKARHARLTPLLVEEKTPDLIARLERGELDCALLAIPVTHDTFAHIPLFSEPFLLAVSHKHRLAGRKHITLADLRAETMLLLEDGHCLRNQALAVCETIGVGEARHFRATSLETLRHMVAAGDAVTLIPALAARDENPLLRYIPLRKPAPARHIGLYFRKTDARTKLFESLAGIVKEMKNHQPMLTPIS